MFDAVDATPDLPEVGPVEASVQRVEAAAGAAGPRLMCRIASPPELRGFTLRAELRYEEETFALAATGRAVTVNASIEDMGDRAIAGGIATMVIMKA